MTQTAFNVVKYCLALFWRFFNSWYIPGTAMTPAGLFMLFAFAAVVIKFWNKFTDNSSVNISNMGSHPTEKVPFVRKGRK